MATKIGSLIQLILAIAIFYLGYSIHTAVSKVGDIVETYPKVIEDISAISSNLKIDQWLAVANTLEKLAPQVIETIDNVTVAVNDTNQTAASINQQIPSIVKELSLYRQTVIPVALKESESYRTAVLPKLLRESEGYRNVTVPQILQESQALRQELPPMLAKADQIIDKSQDIAQQATQGAVKGVIMSPIDLIRDAGNEIKGRVTPVDE